MKRRSLQVLLAMTLACVSPSVVAYQASQSAAPAHEIPPGSSMEEIKAWIEREVPIMGSDSHVITDGQIPLATKYGIESAVLTDCRLTLRTVFQVNDSLAERSTTTLSLRDVNVDALQFYTAPPPGGTTWTENKPSISVNIRAIPGRGEPFTFENAKLHERTDVTSVHIRDQGMAAQVADAFRRAAVLCAALPPTSASQAISKMTNADVIQLVTAGLSEQVITASIRQTPTRNFDLTPTGLIALKKAGVSNALILVMQDPGTPADAPVFTSAKARQDAAVAARASFGASVPGKYFRHDDARDYVELKPDGTFQLQEGRKVYRGTYKFGGSGIRFVADGPFGKYLSSATGKVSRLLKQGDSTLLSKISVSSTAIDDINSQALWEKQPTNPNPPPASPAPAPQNGCSGIELMGVGQIEGGPALGGVNIYVATIRNKAAYTMEVDIE